LVTRHLTADQVAQLRKEVQRQRTKLEASMVVSEEAAKPVPLDQSAVGRLSRMSSLESQGMAKGLQEREAARLALLQDAERRLDSGTYGICTLCGEGMMFERLVIFPESATCMGCG
jgi:DnaK suppressor protein